MESETVSRSVVEESEEDNLDEDDSDSQTAELLFRQSGESPEASVELSNKEEAQIEDQEELEGGER